MLKKVTSKTLLSLSMAGLFSASVMATDVVVDVYYTAEAASNSFNIQSEITQMISASNRYYADNGLDINLVLAADPYQLSTNYVASESDVSSVYKNSDIRGWRDQFNSDFVVVLGSKNSTWQGTTCGIAGAIYGMGDYFPDHDTYQSYAYNITATDCGNTTMTFMHELGHNMGLGHSVEQNTVGGKLYHGVYEYGMGYGVDYEFATIMAYPQAFNTNTHLPVFSDPDRSCGTNLKCGVANESDAQRALDNITSTIAAFR
ncbi:M12 family metallo-peptidase [Thalassomonas sp. RHCl1]|uniref:zinc-dependent metalloprotease family protein n=1 Tax=Thalassomonas sp. RHCl1 TaxID=2995320 RepID=UPI00248CDA02|nr:M12 family metallo-peptidase [Thalassomonas sp. RHCl1]